MLGGRRRGGGEQEQVQRGKAPGCVNAAKTGRCGSGAQLFGAVTRFHI